MSTPEERLLAFDEVVRARRSVRVFEPEPIPDEVMDHCFDLALLAPNSSNLQPWEFYWVRSPTEKKRVVECCLSQPAARTAAEMIVCVGRTDTWSANAREILSEHEKGGLKIAKAMHDYYTRIVPLYYDQGFAGLFGLIKKLGAFVRGFSAPTPREPFSQAGMALWASKSCALACENFMLALCAHGYDSCPLEGFDSARMKKILGLPKRATVVMVIAAGKRAPQGVYGERFRLNKERFVKQV